jgi:hypothetical protein
MTLESVTGLLYQEPDRKAAETIHVRIPAIMTTPGVSIFESGGAVNVFQDIRQGFGE